MSGRRSLTLLIEEEDGRVHLSAPAVGTWSEIPSAGSWLAPGAVAGQLTCLNERFVLRLPADRGGVVEQVAGENRAMLVAYGQRLFRLEPLGDATALGQGGLTQAGSRAESGRVFRAPTDGVFYRKPAPEVPAFVEAGTTLRRGQPIGLIEVMKTFNQVLFEGDDLPDSATVEAVLVEDATEVTAGQALIRFA